MPKVKLSVKYGKHKVGDTADLKKDEAEILIEAGQAVLVEDKPAPKAAPEGGGKGES